jgi:hypothetical protein
MDMVREDLTSVQTPASLFSRRLCDLPTPDSAIASAVRSLRRELDRLNYNPEYSRTICQSAYATHSLYEAIEAGLVELDDAESLTEAFIKGWPEVDSRSVLWKNPDRWEPTHPTPEESREYAELAGSFDPADAPLPEDPDAEQSLDSWLEYAAWSAALASELDAMGSPFDEFEEPELAEAGIRLGSTR